MLEKLGQGASRWRYFILGAWVLLAAGLTVLVTPLNQVVARSGVHFLPGNSPVIQAYAAFNRAFGAHGSQGGAVLVFQDPGGLSPADLEYMSRFVEWAHAHPELVTETSDFFSRPATRSQFLSHDGTTAYMPIGMRASTGNSASSAAIEHLRSRLGEGRPSGLRSWVTGEAAIVADFQRSVTNSIDSTRLLTLFLVILILLLVYRSPVSPLIPLTTIVISYLVARGAVAWAALHGLPVSTFTDTFLIALVFGAGTDYCLFLISRFKEELSQGRPGPASLGTTTRRVGEAMASSAATVVLGGLAMGTASLALFSTTGPAIAIAVTTSLLAGLTLTPALMAIGGKRMFWPRGIVHEGPGRFWTGVSALVVRRPVRVALASVALLALLASLFPTMRVSYDQLSPQPQGNESLVGMRALSGHFPTGELFPQMVLVESSHDLRNPADLMALDEAAVAAARIEGVVAVRAYTRPEGVRIAQTGVNSQLSQVAEGLAQARDGLSSGGAGDRLASGTRDLSAGADRLAQGSNQLTSGLDRASAGAATASEASARALQASQRLEAGAAGLEAGAQQALDGLVAVRGVIQQAHDILAQDPQVAVPGSPAFQAFQYLDHLLYPHPNDAQRPSAVAPIDQLVQGETSIRDGARQLRAGQGALSEGLGQLAAGLSQARSGLAALDQGSRQLNGGLDALRTGAGQLASGTSAAPVQTAQLAKGLDAASQYLDGYTREARAAGLDPFYVPADHQGEPGLALARSIYISPDGKLARMFVLTSDQPYGQAAVSHARSARSAVAGVVAHSRLAGAHVWLGGNGAETADLAAYSQADYARVVVAVLVGVFLILVLLLRSLVAPVYLLGSVVLSYAASMGVTVGLFRVLYGQELDWTVPIFTFVMLVAVGADYNIFLMSRVREEVQLDPVHGIGNAVRRTGRIITSAGLIFAGTFAAMMVSPVRVLQMTGFAVCFGLLLDTFLVRSFLVPALAVIFGPLNWWPRRGPGRPGSALQ